MLRGDQKLVMKNWYITKSAIQSQFNLTKIPMTFYKQIEKNHKIDIEAKKKTQIAGPYYNVWSQIILSSYSYRNSMLQTRN